MSTPTLICSNDYTNKGPSLMTLTIPTHQKRRETLMILIPAMPNPKLRRSLSNPRSARPRRRFPHPLRRPRPTILRSKALLFLSATSAGPSMMTSCTRHSRNAVVSAVPVSLPTKPCSVLAVSDTLTSRRPRIVRLLSRRCKASSSKAAR